MAFKLKSGNKVSFKNMGSSPAKDMKTGSYEHSFESPTKHRYVPHTGHNTSKPGGLSKSQNEHNKSVHPHEKPAPTKQAIDNIKSGGHHYKAYKYHDDYGTGEHAISKKEERKATKAWKKEFGVKGKTGGQHEKRLEKKAARKLKKSEKSQAKYEKAKKAYYDDDINNKKDWKKLQKTRKKADKKRSKATSSELKVRHNRELASVKGDKRNMVELSKVYEQGKLSDMQKPQKLEGKLKDVSFKKPKKIKQYPLSDYRKDQPKHYHTRPAK